MTDLEMTRLCAEAMGYGDKYATAAECGIDEEEDTTGSSLFARIDEFHAVITVGSRYEPLHNDAQAMALVKRFRLRINSVYVSGDRWVVSGDQRDGNDPDLNRAIVECVSKMQKGRGER